jgi:predicted flap endonuclease-1-like 5' DNA nuclease
MKVVEIEGVGEVYAAKLSAAGVQTTEDLLERGGTRKGRQDLAAGTGLSDKQILEWVNRADLFRIKGVGSEYSDLLELAGVDTVVELAQRNPTNLTAAMARALEDHPNVVRRLPAESMVIDWVAQAKKLPRKVEY